MFDDFRTKAYEVIISDKSLKRLVNESEVSNLLRFTPQIDPSDEIITLQNKHKKLAMASDKLSIIKATAHMYRRFYEGKIDEIKARVQTENMSGNVKITEAGKYAEYKSIHIGGQDWSVPIMQERKIAFKFWEDVFTEKLKLVMSVLEDLKTFISLEKQKLYKGIAHE